MAFLTDYRSGAIGRVSLETPQSREAMIVMCREAMIKAFEPSMIQDIVTSTPEIATHISKPDLSL